MIESSGDIPPVFGPGIKIQLVLTSVSFSSRPYSVAGRSYAWALPRIPDQYFTEPRSDQKSHRELALEGYSDLTW